MGSRFSAGSSMMSSSSLRRRPGSGTSLLAAERECSKKKEEPLSSPPPPIKTMEADLRYRTDLENRLTAISTRFINLPTERIDEEIQRALEIVGRFAYADRSYVFLFRENGAIADNTHEWCAEGIEPQKEKLQNLPTASFPWWMQHLGRFSEIHIPSVANLPPEAAQERAILEAQSIQSLIVVPMVYAGRLVGFLGFDAVRVPRQWSEETVGLLRMLADIFTNCIERKRHEEELQRAKCELEARVKERTQELERAHREILAISEREQQRIGQDLHDGLAQHLMGVLCLCRVVAQKVEEGEMPSTTETREIVNLLGDAIEQAKRLARGLCPIDTLPSGLATALRNLAQMITNVFQVRCIFECEGDIPVYDAEKAKHLYRIAQEAIQNSIRHGKAKEIRIALSRRNDEVSLIVRDNGVGVRAKKRKMPTEGMGLRIMEYRSRLMGGIFLFSAEKMKGAVVSCHVSDPPRKRGMEERREKERRGLP